MDFGTRTDGSAKGLGYFGKIPRLDDPSQFSTELSADTEIDGQPVLFPLIVPTLSREEVDHLVSGKPPTKAIYSKAIEHAIGRIGAGKSPFADEGEQMPLPKPAEQDFQDGYANR